MSGSGKSTLLSVLSGVKNYSSGQMTVNGDDIECFGEEDWQRYRKKIVGFVH
jgi:ABC-type lipoprotein export system ATPase subunit